MSRHSKRNRKPPASLPSKRTDSRTTFIVMAAAAVAILGVWWWNAPPADAPAVIEPTAGTPATNALPTATVARSEFQKLTGKWQRLDGGYVIEIKSVDADGKLDAAYFNPKPIHVARAQATMDGTALKVFLELRDVNYPGSTYTLTQDLARDQFNGIYYQALQQQSFEVNFGRIK